ncbi:MAG: hypothetical protein ACYTEZ_15115 [Planctomycetota bacterium]|jgi:hypothetical protein
MTAASRPHPTAAQLASYVVESEAPDESGGAVRRHLEGGCEFCIVAVRRLMELAHEHAGEELRPARRPSWIVPRHLPAPPAAAGTSHLASVRIVCAAGRYELDLLLREYEAPATLRLVGQITRAGRVYEPVRDLPLVLVDAATACPGAETRTDRFGEFDLACRVDATWVLRLGPEGTTPNVLVWDGEPR